MCVQYTQRSEEDIGYPGPGVIEDCEPLFGFWKLKPSTLEGQPVLLPAEPTPQS